MSNKNFLATVVAMICLLTTNVYASIDPDASTILLQKSCDDGTGGTLDNCFVE
jgi:hypothetical protein